MTPNHLGQKWGQWHPVSFCIVSSIVLTLWTKNWLHIWIKCHGHCEISFAANTFAEWLKLTPFVCMYVQFNHNDNSDFAASVYNRVCGFSMSFQLFFMFGLLLCVSFHLKGVSWIFTVKESLIIFLNLCISTSDGQAGVLSSLCLSGCCLDLFSVSSYIKYLFWYHSQSSSRLPKLELFDLIL